MSYQILIKKKKNFYTFYIKELNLVHTSENLEHGYNETNKKKDELINTLRENNIDVPTEEKKSDLILNKQVGVFALKSLIISACITFIICFSLITFFKNINQSADKLKVKTGREFWGQIEKNIIDLGKEENEIKPENHQKAINAIRIIVKRYKPYLKEISKIFDD